jgi:tetratricopeptide (TPR) repeat protein
MRHRIGLCLILGIWPALPIVAQSFPLTELERALKANPRDPKFQNAYGIALQQQGHLEESLARFRTALQLDAKYADAAHNLALALFAANRPAESLVVMDKHPSALADHYALKGAVLSALGRVPDAATSLRRAYELASGNQDYAYDFAVVLLKLEKSEEAAAVLSKARKLFPRSAKIHAASGMLAYLKGQNVEAAREYEAATKIEPGAADLWAALGDVYAATEDAMRAEAAYARSIKLDPATAEYRVKAGRNLLKLQRTVDAESAFRDAIGIDPEDAEAHFQLGKLAAARGDDRAAIVHYEHAVKAQPSFNAAWYQLGLNYRRSGEEAKATQALEHFRKTQ